MKAGMDTFSIGLFPFLSAHPSSSVWLAPLRSTFSLWGSGVWPCLALLLAWRWETGAVGSQGPGRHCHISSGTGASAYPCPCPTARVSWLQDARSQNQNIQQSHPVSLWKHRLENPWPVFLIQQAWCGPGQRAFLPAPHHVCWSGMTLWGSLF